MAPMKKIKEDDFTNRKVREFMRLQEKQLRKKIEHHNLNLNNVHVGATTGKDDLEDMDLNADVVDERIEKQIAKRLNEQLQTVTKGSAQYQLQEQADLKRVKDSFYNLQKKQKQIILELK